MNDIYDDMWMGAVDVSGHLVTSYCSMGMSWVQMYMLGIAITAQAEAQMLIPGHVDEGDLDELRAYLDGVVVKSFEKTKKRWENGNDQRGIDS